MNLIINNLVTNAAVKWSTNIYGPNISQLKAQTTRIRPNPVVDTSIDITDELLEVQKDVKIAMYGLTINSLKFLCTIYLYIYFRTINYMTITTAGYHQGELNEINSVYKKSGFDLTRTRCDNEFKAALDPIVATYDPSITVNYANPQEHVSQADKKINILKNIFAGSITDYRLNGCHMKWLSTWDMNRLGSRICFQESTGFQSFTARV